MNTGSICIASSGFGRRSTVSQSDEFFTALHMHQLAKVTNISKQSFMRVLLFVALHGPWRSELARQLKELAEEIEAMLAVLDAMIEKLQMLLRRLELLAYILEEELKVEIKKLEAIVDAKFFASLKSTKATPA